MRHPGRTPRTAAAILWALIVLSILAVFLVALASQAVADRTWLRRRDNQAQALWLARAGVELAIGRLLSDPAGYTGESVENIPGSQVRIRLRAEREAPDVFLVEVEARYPHEQRDVVVRALTRRVRRTVTNNRARVEVIAAEDSSEAEIAGKLGEK